MEDILIYKIPEYLKNNTFLQVLSIIKRSDYLLNKRRTIINKDSNELFLKKFIYANDLKNINFIKRFISNNIRFIETLKEISDHFLLNKYDHYNISFYDNTKLNYPQITQERIIYRSYVNLDEEESDVIYEYNYPICATYRVIPIIRLFIRNNLNVKALIY